MVNHFIFTVVLTILLSITSFSQQFGTFKDSRDGRIYKTVTVGNQTWMAENLNAHKFLNGDDIPLMQSDTSWYLAGNLTLASKCYYENDPKASDNLGLLYNGYAITDKRKLAPEGWHIPSNEEWEILKLNLLDTIKYKIRFHNQKLEDETFQQLTEKVFPVMAAGLRSYGTVGYGSKFNGLSQRGVWWSSTCILNECTIWGLFVENWNFVNVSRYMGLGLSVRCIKD